MDANETDQQKTQQSIWQKITHIFKTKRSAQALLIIVFVGLGIVGLGFSLAYTGSTSSPSITTCGARVSNYTYKVPFGNAVWNQAACNLPVDPQSTDYVSRFWNYRNGNDLSPSGLGFRDKTITSFGFEPLPSNFSRPVFNAKDANRTIQIQASVYDSNLDGTGASFSNLPKTSIPWNDAWVVGQAGDNEAVILNDQTGEIIYLAGIKKDLEAFTQCGPFYRERLCTYSVQVGRDPSGTKIDYRTYEGSTGDRGSGLSFYATLTTPEEVAAGEIRHALGMAIANTSIGPECTSAQLNTAAEGTICGTAVAPASKFEWSTATKHSTRLNAPTALDSIYTQKALIPEGSRFRLNVDDAYIENWVNSRADLKADTKKAQTARIFARAMRDYGVIIVDTSGVSAIQVASVLNPNTKAAWANLGIDEISDNNLLNGLIGQDNMQLIAPPINNCSNGTKSAYYCKYVTSSYPTASAGSATTGTTTPGTTTSGTTTTTPGTTTPGSTTTQTTPPPVIVPTTVSIPGEFPVAIGWDSRLFEFRQGASLSWGASISPKIITNYIVKKNGKIIYNGVSRAYTDFDLYAGQKYRYEFFAKDSAGNISAPAIYERNYNCTWFGWSCSFSK